MGRIKRWIGVAVGFVTLFFIFSYRNLKKDNEELKKDLSGAHETIKTNQEGVKKVNEIKADNNLDDGNIIERVRSKGYFRKDD